MFHKVFDLVEIKLEINVRFCLHICIVEIIIMEKILVLFGKYFQHNNYLLDRSSIFNEEQIVSIEK